MNIEKSLETSSRRVSAGILCQYQISSSQVPEIGRWVLRALSFLLVLLSLNALAANEESFARLKVGEQTYQNVKVTTKGKNFIIISHSTGIASIKISDLPIDVLQKLGYAPPPKPKKHIKEAAMWASVAVPKADAVLIKPIRTKLSVAWDRTSQAWNKTGLASKIQHLKHDRRAIIPGAAILLTGFLSFSYCGMLICQKTGYNPGLWVFVPGLQAFPLLRAASMSPWWFIVLLIPGINLLVYGFWCVKIVAARQKTLPLAILLIFPLTSWFALLFLALSESSHPEEELLTMDIMTPQSVLPAEV